MSLHMIGEECQFITLQEGIPWDSSSKNILFFLKPLWVLRQGYATPHARGYLVELNCLGYHLFVPV